MQGNLVGSQLLSKRLVSFIKSCTVKNIQELKCSENEIFPLRRVSLFWDRWGKIFIVKALSLSYKGQCRRQCFTSSLSALQWQLKLSDKCLLYRSKFRSLMFNLSLHWIICSKRSPMQKQGGGNKIVPTEESFECTNRCQRLYFVR